MTKHTPGPWRYARDETLSYYADPGSKFGAASIEAPDARVAFVVHHRDFADESRATVYLIAAAPELLEAMKELLGLVETLQPVVLGESERAHQDRRIRALANSAIKKAESGKTD